MTNEEIIITLESILSEANRLTSGNVVHVRSHIIAGVQTILDDITQDKK